MVSSQASPDLICQWHFTVFRSPTVLKTFLLCSPEPQTLLDSLWTEGRLFYQIFLFPIYKSWWAPKLLPFSLYSVLWSSMPAIRDSFPVYISNPTLSLISTICASWKHFVLFETVFPEQRMELTFSWPSSVCWNKGNKPEKDSPLSHPSWTPPKHVRGFKTGMELFQE